MKRATRKKKLARVRAASEARAAANAPGKRVARRLESDGTWVDMDPMYAEHWRVQVRQLEALAARLRNAQE